MHQLSRRRTIYLVAIALGLPVLALAWWLHQDADPFQRYAHLVQGGFLVWAFQALWRESVPVQRVERATFWTLGVLWVGNYAVALHTGQAFEVGWGEFVTTVMLNFFVLAALSHLMFATRTAVRINLALFAACLVVGLTRFVPDLVLGLHRNELTSLIQFSIALAVVICFLYVLAKSKDDHLEAELAARALGEFALQDSLTGLPNRRHIVRELDRLIEIGRRYGRPLTLISFDLDHFKSINDTHGHPVGDEVLIIVADRAKEHLRRSDTLGRWGGEEFLIIATETDERYASTLAERVREAIEAATYPLGVHVTASFGVTTLKPGMSRSDLLREVDRRLYVAKDGGRNRVEVTAAATPATSVTSGTLSED